MRSSASAYNSIKNPRYQISASYGGNKKIPLHKTDVDYLIAYLPNENIWYIIPIEAITGRVKISIAIKNRESEWLPYKEAWHLLMKGN